jgi:hypothetical protein
MFCADIAGTGRYRVAIDCFNTECLKAAVSDREVEKIAVDRAWVLAMLTEDAQRGMQVEPVRDLRATRPANTTTRVEWRMRHSSYWARSLG